jgi:hypothetical protein
LVAAAPFAVAISDHAVPAVKVQPLPAGLDNVRANPERRFRTRILSLPPQTFRTNSRPILMPNDVS